MAMTREERATQIDLANRLGEQGYATYAKLFMLFELRLTSDPRYIGFMEPSKGRITLNRTIEPHQMLLTIRHEILHEYLSHELRLLEHLAEKYPEYDGDEVSLKKILYKNKDFNIAGDYEISNRGYTEQDKEDIRHIKFNGQIVSGLVTEDQHPDWVNLTVEEMYDLLQDEREKDQENAQQDQGNSDEQGQDQSDNQQGDQSDNGSEQGDDENGSNDEESDGDSDEGESNDDKSSKGESGKEDSNKEGSDKGDESEGDEDSNDSNSNNGSGGQDSNEEDSEEQQQPSNSQANGGKDSKSSGSIKVIRGVMRNGKFYDLNGNEIRPGA